jgi:hypothetical protein
MEKIVLIFSVVAAVTVSCAHAIDFTADCLNSENPIACRGANFLAKAFNQVVTNHDEQESVPLMPGLELIQNENINHVYNERSMVEQQNEPFIMRVARYLQTHDLKIRFSEILGKTDLQEVVNNIFNSDDPAMIGELVVHVENII